MVSSGGRVRGLRKMEEWVGAVPAAVVILTLLGLLIVPPLLQDSISREREEIDEAADPARTEVTQIQYQLARQTSALRGFLITGDSSYLEQFRELAEQELRSYQQLEPLVRRLGAEAVAQFSQMQTLSAEWHQRVAEVRPAPGQMPTTGQIPYERELYLRVLEAGNDLDDAIVRATRERRDRIREIERRMQLIQLLLVALALVAVSTVLWLGARVRRLALVAEARRQEAERALADSARAVEAKARLLRGLTHDVKNPLGVVDGYADLLEMGINGELSPAQQRMVAGIRRAVHSAVAIIDDLLDLSRAETGTLLVEREPVALDPLVSEVVEDHRTTAAAAGLALEVSPAAERIVSYTDQGRVRQILGNLLGNAVKYTPQGGRIQVQLALEPPAGARGGEGWAAIRVHDTGPGIPPEHRELIFEEFHRIPGSAAPGHGLGLAISRRLARLLGGDLAVEDRAEGGSTFVLRLPARVAARDAHSAPG